MFSHINISKLPASATERHPNIAGAKAQAMGVSLVIHPKIRTSRPHMPMYVYLWRKKKVRIRSGGLVAVLTSPFYPNDEDVLLWHQTAYDLCAPFGEEVYQNIKMV